MLDTIELYNFKSYRGRHVISLEKPFLTIVGSNGTGKSNILDAVSFILGLRNSTLRSSALAELVNVSDRFSLNDEESSATAEASQDTVNNLAYVKLRFDQDKEFQRNITRSFMSEYRYNGRPVSYAEYTKILAEMNIFVKARNFLVFQGDIEAIASQSSHELTRVIEEISGSIELKDAQEKAQSKVDRATRAVVEHMSRKRSATGKLRQEKHLRKENDAWRTLMTQRDEAILRLTQWQLFHTDRQVCDKLNEYGALVSEFTDLQRNWDSAGAARRESTQHLIGLEEQAASSENRARQESRLLEETQSQLASLKAQLAHSQKAQESVESNIQATVRDREQTQRKIAALEEAIKRTKEDRERQDQEQERNTHLHELLTDSVLQEYTHLCQQAKEQNLELRSRVDVVASQLHLLKSKRDSLDDQVSREAGRQRVLRDALAKEEASLSENESRKRNLVAELELTKADLASRRSSLSTFQAQSASLKKLIDDLNDQITNLNLEFKASEHSRKLDSGLAKLSASLSGIKGKLSSLCEPTHTRYTTALFTSLGRHLDSIVVESDLVAFEAVEYLRIHRLGSCTFLPISSIRSKTPSSSTMRPSLLHYGNVASYAVDLLTYHESLAPIFDLVLGNTIICQNNQTAISLREQPQFKLSPIVTLEGTLFHSSGLISVGVSDFQKQRQSQVTFGSDASKLAAQESALQTRRTAAVRDLENITLQIQKAQDDSPERKLSSLERDINIIQESLARYPQRIHAIKAELKNIQAKHSSLSSSLEDLTSQVSSIEQSHASLVSELGAAEATLFKPLLSSLSLASPEQLHSMVAERKSLPDYNFSSNMTRLSQQLEFNKQHLASLMDRLSSLESVLRSHHDTQKNLSSDIQTSEARLVETSRIIDELQRGLESTQANLVAAREKASQARASVKGTEDSLAKVHNNGLFALSQIKDLLSDKLALLSKSSSDEIPVPLLHGASLEDLPAELNWSVPVTNNTLLAVVDLPALPSVDYALLSDDDQADASTIRRSQIEDLISQIDTQIQEKYVHVRMLDHLLQEQQDQPDPSSASSPPASRMQQIEADFDRARGRVRAARQELEAIKNERRARFITAFDAIAQSIDPVFKELTKSPRFPLGGSAFLTLEDSENPFTHGIRFHAMPPSKRFRDMSQLSGGERTMAALALLFAIQVYKPAPFFFLDEVDAALDSDNVSRVAAYIRRSTPGNFQFIVISLRDEFFESSDALLGVYRNRGSHLIGYAIPAGL